MDRNGSAESVTLLQKFVKPVANHTGNQKLDGKENIYSWPKIRRSSAEALTKGGRRRAPAHFGVARSPLTSLALVETPITFSVSQSEVIYD